MPPDLNRKSISLLLTAAGREKLLISDADLCKSRICLRSTCLFDLKWHLRHLCMHCCCLLLNPDCYFFSRKIQSAGLTRLGGRLNSSGRSTQLPRLVGLCPLPSLPTAVDVVRGEVVCGGREYGRWQFGRARPIVIPAPPRLATVAAAAAPPHCCCCRRRRCCSAGPTMLVAAW